MTLVHENPDLPIMAQQDRLEWLCWYFARSIHTSRVKTGDGPWREITKSYSHSTLDLDFVDAYLRATNAGFGPMVLGAHRCPMLASDLKRLHEQKTLDRWRSGVEGMGPGWPRWVWNYIVAQDALDQVKRRAEWFDARVVKPVRRTPWEIRLPAS
jgi:hypothetical protein